MKERGIIMQGESVLGILDGRKSQTRRVIKERVSTSDHGMGHNPMVLHKGYWYRPVEWSPYGQPGDRLWVRETTIIHLEPCDKYPKGVVYYRTEYPDDGDYTPSIFMPRWASRIMLEIVSVRVERVQDISKADCIGEGITGLEDIVAGWHQLYAKLWDSINAKRGYGWDVNPLVWVIEFKVLL